MAHSCIHTAAQDAGAIAELAAARKTAKYAALESRYIIQPIAMETLGPIIGSAVSFLSGLGRRIADVLSKTREDRCFLFQRLSLSVQRFNAVLHHEYFVDRWHVIYHICSCLSCFVVFYCATLC